MLADRMFMAATPKVAAPGQQAYTTAGTYTFTVPAGVTSICVLCVGGGAGSGQQRPGAGGSLAYINNLSVTPGNNITVVVGAGGTGTNASQSPQAGSDSSFGSGPSVRAKGGSSASTNIGDVTQLGGNEGGFSDGGGGGGGAGGYSGVGGNGGDYGSGGGTAGASGSGGGGGGGGGGALDITNLWFSGGGGGGVGLLGSGSNGSGGAGAVVATSGSTGGGGGSGGSSGASSAYNATAGGAYGGGAGGSGMDGSTLFTPANGGVGAVRIIWGAGRSYPSNAANV